MLWYDYLAHFFAGAFLANGVPHFVQGICGNKFQTPFASPPGVGKSSAIVNVLWGLFNFAVAAGCCVISSRRCRRRSAAPLLPRSACSSSRCGSPIISARCVGACHTREDRHVSESRMRSRFAGLWPARRRGGGQEGRDMKLEDVGFIMRPANTPAQIERLRLLPPRKFVARSRAGWRYYLYADPDYCKCIFLGDELAMRNYRDLICRRRSHRCRWARMAARSPAR